MTIITTPALDPTGGSFTPTTHSKPTGSTDLSVARLPSPFAVCIIGCARGIGAGIARAYATAGASQLILADLEEAKVTAAQIAQIRPAARVHLAHCNISDASSVASLATKVTHDVGRLDVLVAVAGYAGPVNLRVTDGEPLDFQRNFEVNAIGPYHAAHYFIPLLQASNGARAFVAVASTAAWITDGPIANTGYCISKLATLRLIDYIARQFEGEISAFAVHPGAVKTEMAKDTPEEFVPYLVDDVGLCGAFCVWLTKLREERAWLSGRFLLATWDVDELLARREDIVRKDLLKARLALE
ncbi:MAG: putative secondary metabolism biosynthetic enzyme [Sclerophora amabilis]|nr:MAG: putative secondary metabolism biosynthetic enzyme [Sclerophora amabilis]